MSLLINFTRQPLTVTGTGALPTKEAVEVLGLRDARLSLRVINAKFTPMAFQFEVTLEGNMVREEYGWATLASFPIIDDAPQAVTVTLDKPLRYLRWNVKTFTAATSVLFQLDGVGWG